MRRPSVFLNRRESLDVAMTPMIDVVFLLLVFFVWTASFSIVEYALPTAVTQTAGNQPANLDTPPPPEADFDNVVVRVLAGPRFELNGQTLETISELQERLREISSVRTDTPTVIHPDADVAMGAAVDAFDAARSAGFTKVAFAVSSSS
ncbi:MAG: biopolymer transporter ExbD [Planctomycetales bacterium]|nr:biopolymer transporter ExbD [Planctomycetales bacterium]